MTPSFSSNPAQHYSSSSYAAFSAQSSRMSAIRAFRTARCLRFPDVTKVMSVNTFHKNISQPPLVASTPLEALKPFVKSNQNVYIQMAASTPTPYVTTLLCTMNSSSCCFTLCRW